MIVLCDFVAGLDTVVTALHTFVAYMAMNPDIQAKLREEVDTVCGKLFLIYCHFLSYEVSLQVTFWDLDSKKHVEDGHFKSRCSRLRWVKRTWRADQGLLEEIQAIGCAI